MILNWPNSDIFHFYGVGDEENDFHWANVFVMMMKMGTGQYYGWVHLKRLFITMTMTMPMAMTLIMMVDDDDDDNDDDGDDDDDVNNDDWDDGQYTGEFTWRAGHYSSQQVSRQDTLCRSKKKKWKSTTFTKHWNLRNISQMYTCVKGFRNYFKYNILMKI